MSQPLALLLVGIAFAAPASEPNRAKKSESVAAPSFYAHIRPLFKAYCTECHGEEGKPKAGLDLRLRHLSVKGGKSGAAIVPGKPDDSLLMERVVSEEMPPGKKKLSAAEMDLLRRWIAAGAPVEEKEPDTLPLGFQFSPDDRRFWVFQPIQAVNPPKMDGVPNPIDAFLLAKLQEHKLTFSAPADKLTLLRRVTLDLTGLPPTPEEMQAFMDDASPNAFERVVDRLLASKHYGERWGRHWLDVAGYADSEGASPEDPVRTNAWQYRDYVIRSFNADKPFDRFIREQLAGDELVKSPYSELPPQDLDALIATGFLRMAPDGTGSGAVDQKLARNQVLTDTVKIVSSAFLGITVGCAQCHNHRYDPVPQTDFYRLRAIFEPALDPANWKAPAARQVSLYSEKDKKKAAEIEAEAKKIEAERLKKQQSYIDATFDKEVAKLPRELQEQARLARSTAEAKRTPEQKKLMREHPSLNVSAGSLYLYDSKAAAELTKLSNEAADVRKKKPVEVFVRALTESPGKLPATFLHHRGDPDQPKEAVPPGGLAILDSTLPLTVEQKSSTTSSGRRLALANWLTDPKHPLTSRVLVNRVWMHHFGRGLVGTAGDFGRLGERPTHPELLDWLAKEFVQSGWSMKTLHRRMLLTRAYQQSSRRSVEADAIDPANHLLSHYPLRRLDAETLRDSALAITGTLNAKMFGSPVPVKENEVGAFVLGIDTKDGAGRFTQEVPLPAGDEYRRSVYVQVRRTRPLAELETFDWATLEPNCEVRNSSTATPQSLMLLNGEFLTTQSEAFAARLLKEAGADPAKQVSRAWQLLDGRKPSDRERAEALQFLSESRETFLQAGPVREAAPAASSKKPVEKKPASKQSSPEQRALALFCQALLSSNRFLYVD